MAGLRRRFLFLFSSLHIFEHLFTGILAEAMLGRLGGFAVHICEYIFMTCGDFRGVLGVFGGSVGGGGLVAIIYAGQVKLSVQRPVR